MSRICTKIGIVFLTGVLVILCLLLFGHVRPALPIDLSFAERVTIEYMKDNADIDPVEITDPHEIRHMASLLKGVSRDSAGCPFDMYRLTFSGGGRSLALLPAGDDCDAVSVDYGAGAAGTYTIGRENRQALLELMEGYGIPVRHPAWE